VEDPRRRLAVDGVLGPLAQHPLREEDDVGRPEERLAGLDERRVPLHRVEVRHDCLDALRPADAEVEGGATEPGTGAESAPGAAGSPGGDRHRGRASGGGRRA
jgi:hypothetical protein